MKLKKLISAIAVIGALTCASAFAASMELVVDGSNANKEVEAGQVITVGVNLTNNPGVVQWVARLTETGGITLTKKPAPTAIFPLGNNSRANLSLEGGYPIDFGDGSAEENITATGVICEFDITIPADAKGGDSYTLTLTGTKSGTIDFDVEEVDFGSDSITFTVKADEPQVTPATIDDIKNANDTLGSEYAFYTTVNVDLTANAGAKFKVAKGSSSRIWALPEGITGNATFVAVVKTNQAGTYVCDVVNATGDSIAAATKSITVE